MNNLAAGLILGSPDLYAELAPLLRGLRVRVVLEQTEPADPASVIAGIERMQPDTVLVDAEPVRRDLFGLVQAIRRSAAAPAVVVVDRSADADSILAAMRAGAAEYLIPPFGANLGPALERVSAGHISAVASKRGHVIGALGAKGGLGTTTIACHLAAEFERVAPGALLADLDLKTGLAAILLRVTPKYSILDALNNVDRLDESLWRTLIVRAAGGLDVIAAPGGLVPRNQPQLDQLHRVLRFARSQYSWVVADLGSGLSPNVLHLADEVDEMLVVTTLEIPALQQTKRLIRNLIEHGAPRSRLKLVVNRLPKRADIRLKELEGLLELEVYRTFANDYEHLYECYSEGRLLDRKGQLGQQLAAAARSLAGVEPPPKRRSFGLFEAQHR